MKKESNRLKAKKKLTFYMRWDFWERQAKKAFFLACNHYGRSRQILSKKYCDVFAF